MDRKRVTIRKTEPGFASREHRAGFGLLIGTGLLALILGGVYLIRQLNQPFDANYEGPRFVTSEELQQVELEKQKITDTDSDGLSDYDEIYLYRTSPYLFDSDGDGLSDAAEVMAGDDPNCPKGEKCLGTVFAPPGSGGQSFLDNADAVVASSAQNIFAISESVKNLNIEQVRQLLLQAGMEEEVVNGLSDADLFGIYQVVISDLEESGELEQIISSATSEQPSVQQPVAEQPAP